MKCGDAGAGPVREGALESVHHSGKACGLVLDILDWVRFLPCATPHPLNCPKVTGSVSLLSLLESVCFAV